MISMPILMGLVALPDWLGRFSIAVVIIGVFMWAVSKVQGRQTSGQETRRSIAQAIKGDWSHQEWSGPIPGINSASFKVAADIFAQSSEFVVHGFNPGTGLLMLRGRLDARTYGYVTTVRCTPGPEHPEVTVTCSPYSSVGYVAVATAKKNVTRVVATLQAVAALAQEPATVGEV